MTTASKVTMIRIAMIPIFFVVMMMEFPYADLIALFIFAVASATDGIDGYIARKYNQVSDFGKFIDPLADKLLVMSAIMIFVQWGQMPSWAAMIIITREFAVTGLRLVAVEGGVVIAAGTSGKVKTVTSIIAICFMLTPLHGRNLLAGITVDDICVWLMVITTVWSGVEYFVQNRSLLDVRK
jgi:CDP-diacylglycerol--glycerol-3-phosphate 3-phosphatidyltransferase